MSHPQFFKSEYTWAKSSIVEYSMCFEFHLFSRIDLNLAIEHSFGQEISWMKCISSKLLTQNICFQLPTLWEREYSCYCHVGNWKHKCILAISIYFHANMKPKKCVFNFVNLSIHQNILSIFIYFSPSLPRMTQTQNGNSPEVNCGWVTLRKEEQYLHHSTLFLVLNQYGI